MATVIIKHGHSTICKVHTLIVQRMVMRCTAIYQIPYPTQIKLDSFCFRIAALIAVYLRVGKLQ